MDQKAPPPAYFRTVKLIKSQNAKRPESQNMSKKSSIMETSPNNANSQLRASNDTLFNSGQLLQNSNSGATGQLPPRHQSQLLSGSDFY